jgi:protein associated with RNAse G/E
LDHIFREQLDILIEMTENMEGPFRPGFAEKWYDAYLKSEKEKV